MSGNVSLYNETNGRAILPTPTIGGVGLLDDFTKSATLAFKAADEAILLVGETQGWLGQSLYLRDICEREEGAPPPVDLAAERRNGDFVRALIAEGASPPPSTTSPTAGFWSRSPRWRWRPASAPSSRRRRSPRTPSGSARTRPAMSSRCPPGDADRVAERARAAGVPVRTLGSTGGDALTLAGERPVEGLRRLAAGLHGWSAGGMIPKSGNRFRKIRLPEDQDLDPAGIGGDEWDDPGREFHGRAPALGRKALRLAVAA